MAAVKNIQERAAAFACSAPLVYNADLLLSVCEICLVPSNLRHRDPNPGQKSILLKNGHIHNSQRRRWDSWSLEL